MAYTRLQMLMNNLKNLIHGNHHPLINNNPMVLSERPQFQLLYQELASIIQTLFNFHEDHHPEELQKVRNLKRRFKDVAEDAEDIIDLYLCAATVDFRKGGLSLASGVLKTSLDLANVMRSIESIKVEFMTINFHDMKMDSSPRIDSLNTHFAADAVAVASTSNSRTRRRLETVVVGLKHDVEIIRDKLVEDTRQLSIVSIVGMGGLGKTTLATKLFNDSFLKYHFHIRAWATISQTYTKRDLLIQILTSSGVQRGLDQASVSELHEKLHKHLMGRRYLIVIDDIWSIEAWDEMKLFFPNDNTESRILLTSRLNEVASHVTSHGLVHPLPCLTEEESWGLLKQKVFYGAQCPEELIEPGRQIARKCHGLPLSVVVMAGVLANEPMSNDSWKEIACNIGSYYQGNLETLALSYDHLPNHLRVCFLYLGGFSEDFRFNAERLIWLLQAKGFIEEVENRSLEDTAKAYLTDLINRNLVIVAKINEIGDVKACSLHDLVRELCLQKAKDERFFIKVDSPPLFTDEDINIVDVAHFPTQTIRSVLCFHEHIHSVKFISRSFFLLRVLDLQKCLLDDSPHGLASLVHLKYLAIWFSSQLPHTICKLWSLETLILKTRSGTTHLPRNITDLVNLKYLWSDSLLYLPYIGRPMNLQSITNVEFIDGVNSFQKCFPKIKKLALSCGNNEYHFELLSYLEILKLTGLVLQQNHLLFPATLTKLTLVRCFLPWSEMSIIQSLPNLEVLKLKDNAFNGEQWDAREHEFRELKILTLQSLNIKQWETYSTSFPCLKQLSLLGCYKLEELPLEIGGIVTLELIETDSSNNSIVESVEKIQHDERNDVLKITVDGMDLSFYLSQCKDS